MNTGTRPTHLALYHYDMCPYCYMVRSAIDHLGIEVELRNTIENPRHREDLIAARGAPTVPVLRITHEGGEEEWMPESADIVRYLESL